MENLELVYESRGSRNYLCVKVSDELSGFQAKMLENNEIPCLLPMRSRSINGVYCLDYDITGKSRLVDILESRQIRGEKAKNMLWNLLDGLLATEEFFLSYTQCILDLNYIFYSDDEKPGIVYLPLKNMEISQQDTVKELFQDLLVNYLSEENELFFMDLLRYVNKREFSVPGLYKLLKDSIGQDIVVKEAIPTEQSRTEEKSKGFFGRGAAFAQQEKSAAVESESQKTITLVNKPAPVSTPTPAPALMTPPQAGFAIPGAGPAVPPAATAPAKKEKEKKPLFSFSSGNKKEKPAAPAGNVPPMAPPPMGAMQPNAKIPVAQGKVPPMGVQGIPPMAPPPVPAPVPAQAPQKQKGGLFSKHAPATPVMSSAAPMPNQAPIGAAPAADQWKGTVMMSNENGGGKTIMMGVGGSFPFLRHAGNTVTLDHFPFVIGKQNADYIISKGVISRTHATIVSKNGSYFIKDENSSNHTFVNGAQIPPFTECEIFSGDRIRLADEELEFIVEG